MKNERTRRAFLRQTGGVVSGLLIPISSVTAFAAEQAKSKAKEEEQEVTPNEDLMREHGLLRRVLLIYDEFMHRLNDKKEGKPDFDPAIVITSADIVRKFVENYHEQLEQDHVFPRLQKAGKLRELVATLLEQHRIGRILTEKIKQSANGATKNHEDAKTLSDCIYSFQRMYRAHAAREDTVLFPEFKRILTPNEYDSLGEQFEKIETQKFGEDGFEHMLAQVADIEKKLGIYDLNKYTAKV